MTIVTAKARVKINGCEMPARLAGRRSLVIPVSRGAVATGVDGLIIETHPSPERAIKDGPQSLSFVQFEQLMREIGPIANAVGMKL